MSDTLEKVKIPKKEKNFASNGKFIKGNTIGSMPKNQSFMNKLKEALENVEEREGKTLAEHAIEMAFTDKQVLIAVLKKFAPDLAQVQVQPDGAFSVTFNIKDFRKEASK